jgi:menaquinone-dependent protoporphyrinogen IX oxidase
MQQQVATVDDLVDRLLDCYSFLVLAASIPHSHFELEYLPFIYRDNLVLFARHQPFAHKSRNLIGVGTSAF